MKTTVKIIAIAFISFATTTQLSAQNRKGPQGGPQDGPKGERAEKLSAEEEAQKLTDRMAKTLDLSEKQSKELYDINLKYATQREEQAEKKKEEMKEQQEAQKAEREEAREAMKENAEQRTNEIKAILTSEQQEEFEKLEKRGKREGGPRGGQGGPRGGEGAPRGHEM